MSAQDKIIIRGARVHNLKNISLEIPKNKLVVITGLSGSGKSSLAFDTIYAEGQRRYAESLSAYARQFLEMQDKPDVDEITGLSPTVAIDQRSGAHTPRSTVGTVTEIYDHLRLLFSRIGLPHCPSCKEPVTRKSAGQMVEFARTLVREGHTLRILAPIFRNEIPSNKKFFSTVEETPGELFRFDGAYLTKDELLAATLPESRLHSLEVLVGEVGEGREGNITSAIERALEWGNGLLIMHHLEDDLDTLISEDFMCSHCNRRLEPLLPRLFSFNSPHGACPGCQGLGVKLIVDPDLVIPNAKLTLAEGAIEPWMRITGNQMWYLKLLGAVAHAHEFSVDEPWSDLPRKARDLVLYGTGEKEYVVEGKKVLYDGVIPNLEARHRDTTSDYIRKEIEEYMREEICPTCEGKRLREEALAVTVAGKNISEVVSKTVEDAAVWLAELVTDTRTGKPRGKGASGGIRLLSDRDTAVAQPIVKEILRRLHDLKSVGLDYLTLDRSMTTLAGGEVQRVRLSTQLTTGLSGVIYILDEPSIGMHPSDIEKLIHTLQTLRDVPNSVLVVEHDAAIMKMADHIIDVGPGAGVYGGMVVAAGTPREIEKHPASLTGKYLSGHERIRPPKQYRKGNGKSLTIVGATAHNLKNISAKFPLGCLICVTGVSGSGKSTLINDILARALAKHFYRAKAEPGPHKAIKGLEHIDKVITVDQTAIGRTPRSNPATYTSVFTAIRDLFTAVPEAKARGYDAGKFSFNVKGGGRCEACAGEGYVRIPMQFLTDVYVECDECKGARYNREALEIHFRDKNIAQVLNMTVEEALQFFHTVQGVTDKLTILHEVGLGYIKLGQPATNLSGGEAQRVKLSTELARRATGKTLYILDEPTTGLHFEDIKKLLGVLQTLVEKGNTVCIIEHNLDVVKCADFVIDLGPGGGVRGGYVVAEGAPREIAKVAKSVTGRYLLQVLR